MTNRKNKTTPGTPSAATTTSGTPASAAEADEAAAEAVGPAETAGGAKRPKKYPCGKCDEEVRTASLHCRTCEQWFHKTCIEGMTPQYFENCQKTYEEVGVSAFLCKTCMKVWDKVQKQFKDLKDEIREIGNRVTVLELEKETLAQKVENMEMRTVKVKEGLEDVEKEVVSGMLKAKEQVVKDVRTEMVEREERSANLVIYGLEESNEEAPEKRKEEEDKKARAVAEAVGVEMAEGVEMKFRAGKKNNEAGAKPRPMIVKVQDDETRERMLGNASRLARTADMKRVFISPDLTWEQREEARKVERSLREEAEKKTEEAKNEGREGKYLVVGQRGRRRIVWIPGGAEGGRERR